MSSNCRCLCPITVRIIQASYLDTFFHHVCHKWIRNSHIQSWSELYLCSMWVILTLDGDMGGGTRRRQPHQSRHQATGVHCEAHYSALNKLPAEQWEAPGPWGTARGWLGLICTPRGACSPGPVTTRLSSTAAKLHSPLPQSSAIHRADTVWRAV